MNANEPSEPAAQPHEERPTASHWSELVEARRQLALATTALREAELKRTEAQEFAAEMEEWQNRLAMRVPESYEASEGSQEGCIERWVDDLEMVATPLIAELCAWPEDEEGPAEITVPLMPDSVELERLFAAADRLGGDES